MSKKGDKSAADQWRELQESGDPLAGLTLLQKIRSGQMSVEEIYALDQVIAADQVIAPFPADKVQRCLKRIQQAKQISELRVRDSEALFHWCADDHHVASVFQAGATSALVHTLVLCRKYAEARSSTGERTPVPDDFRDIRKCAIYSVAEGCLNHRNQTSEDMRELVPLIVEIILQEGAIAEYFPVDVSTMNLAIKACGEIMQPVFTQRQRNVFESIAANKPLFTVVLSYVKEGNIEMPPCMSVRSVSSALCYTRFIQQMYSVHLGPQMVHLGYIQALKAVKLTNAQGKHAITSTLQLLEGNHEAYNASVSFAADYEGHKAPQIRRSCDFCSREEDPKAPLKLCSQCKKRRYCGRECQLSDWKGGHAKVCPTLKK